MRIHSLTRSVILFSLLLFLSGCDYFKSKNNSVFTNGDFKSQETLFMGFLKSPTGFDWSKPLDFSETTVVTNIMEGLTKLQTINGEIKAQPALAQSWEVSEDGKKVTFKLRSNVKWSDGKILNAGEFVEGFKRLLDPSNSVIACNFLFSIINAENYYVGKTKNFSEVGITVKDESTLVFSLNHPVPYFALIFANPGTYPVHKEQGSDYTKAITLGPYKIVTLTNRHAVLVRNERYYGRKSSIKNLVFRFGLSIQDALRFFNSNQLDIIADIAPHQGQKFLNRTELLNATTLNLIYLGFDVHQKPLSSPIIRRAIGRSIDRKEALLSLNGFGDPITGIVPPHLLGFESNRGVRFDPGAAETLLKNSGYNTLIKSKSILLKIGDSSEFEAFGENIASQLKRNLGLDIKLVKENVTERAKDKEGPMMYLAKWQATVPDADNFMNLYKSNSKQNIIGWKNKEFDELARQAAQEQVSEKRERIYSKALHTLTEEEIPVLPLVIGKQYYLVKSRVHSLYSNILNHLVLKEASLE